MPFGSELSETTATSSLRGVQFGKFLGFLGPRFLVCPSVFPPGRIFLFKAGWYGRIRCPYGTASAVRIR